MSDSILVRVTLGSYDFAHPAEKQTHVYVQIPEVARASWMLPADMFHGLAGRAWPEVLDVAHDHYLHSGVVSDSTSAAARAAVRAWLLEDPNRDEMQAAWEEDQARRDPVAGKLLRDNERLRARVTELEKANAGLDDLRQQALARVAEVEAERSADKLTRLLAPTQALREDEPAAPLTVFRASHDSIVMGLYRTRGEARKHCETVLRREIGDEVWIGWVPDDGGEDAPEELCFGEDVECSGYYVTPMEVASAYDPDGDE
jgi:hypothetical protein